MPFHIRTPSHTPARHLLARNQGAAQEPRLAALCKSLNQATPGRRRRRAEWISPVGCSRSRHPKRLKELQRKQKRHLYTGFGVKRGSTPEVYHLPWSASPLKLSSNAELHPDARAGVSLSDLEPGSDKRQCVSLTLATLRPYKLNHINSHRLSRRAAPS